MKVYLSCTGGAAPGPGGEGREGEASLKADFQAVPFGTHGYLALKNKVTAEKNNLRAK